MSVLKGSLPPQHVLSFLSLFQKSPFNNIYSNCTHNFCIHDSLYTLPLRKLKSAIPITSKTYVLLSKSNKKALKKLSAELSIRFDTETPKRARLTHFPLLEMIQSTYILRRNNKDKAQTCNSGIS